MKADFHNHVVFLPEEMYIQRQGYYGKGHVLTRLVQVGLKKDLGLIAVTDSYNRRQKREEKRFDMLLEGVDEARMRGYGVDIGKLLITIRKDDKVLRLIKGQSVSVQVVPDRPGEHLVIGANDVPNGKPLAWIQWLCRERGLPQIMEHGFRLFGGLRRYAKDFVEGYDAVELDSHASFSELLYPIPIIGAKSRKANNLATKLARDSGKSLICTSDSHRIESAGNGCIEFYDNLVDFSDEENVPRMLRDNVIAPGNFLNHHYTESITEWLRWQYLIFV